MRRRLLGLAAVLAAGGAVGAAPETAGAAGFARSYVASAVVVPAFESAVPAVPSPAPVPASGISRREAALAGVVGSEVDAKPVYGAVGIIGAFGLALFLAIWALTGGLNR